VRREFRHWLVGNIPGDKVNQGETLTEYVGSGPPKDTGKTQKFKLQTQAVPPKDTDKTQGDQTLNTGLFP
jgi:phosphatidylethanolamine-binding protein (PEBP) family uncharacterized protein